ncbi:neuronal PAS domain-containing protein 4A-like [Megalops cyprinoides]|uniref:neuronal PAS domain-containing protein 4A-like n=1 Tax=Megalops cyprinoides TaxID=118141 RepID=UPI001863BF5A|nr:neuronal PAS domain-containing protein 4A-like [Megalops cyprinoides]
MYRSTKGASKARRDQINAEIRNLKELLPIPDADKARLSYLHIMSLACMYTRKAVFFSQEAEFASSHEESARFMSFHELSELVHELPGFLMMLTSEGKLLYLSDSVTEHLGHSMVDLVAQGDSVYDIIDPTDHFVMRSNLAPTTTPDTDRLFRCRFNTSKSVRRQSAGSRLALIRARCLSTPGPASSYWTSNPVWLCFCSPLEGHPTSPVRSPPLTPPADHAFFLAGFHSQHSQDMRLQDAEDSVSVYLGYDVQTLRSRSWYSLVHPQDLPHASAQHCSLMSEGGEGRVEMVIRVETADHSWIWLYMVLHLEAGENPISCRNFVISETEAWSVRQQLCTEQTQLALVLSASASYQDSLGLQSPDTLSSPDQVFTPSSSGLSGQSFDFSAAASSMSSSEELGGATAESVQPEGGDPRSSLSSLEEESFSQQSQQQPPQQSSDPAASPAPGASPTQETASDLDFLTQVIFPPPSLHTVPRPPAQSLPSLTMPHLQQGHEQVCTPPYTPQVGGGAFMFGESLYTDCSTTPTAANPPVAMTTSFVAPANRPVLLPLSVPCPSSEMLVSLEHCGNSIYEKLPPTPDTPGGGDCTVMALPEVRGPLFVDVPQGAFCYPPEGLLTPDTSPGEQYCRTTFSLQMEKEKERAEISLLAQHISSLADGFCSNPLLPKCTPSSSIFPSNTAQPPVQDSAPPLGELYPVKPWRGLDSPLFPDDCSLFEESVLESLLQELLCSSSSSSTPLSPHPSSPSPSSPPPSPPTPECWCPHPSFEGGASIGASHLCSVQSAHCNCMAVGGATAGAEAGVMEMDTSSSSIPACPALLTAPSALSVPATPVSPTMPGQPRAQSLLGELATLEPVFGAGASIAPVPGQQPELYQLHRDPSPQHFRQDGSGSDPPF